MEALPDGYTWTHPTPADAQDIVTFVGAYNMPLIGYPDVTVDEMHDDLSEPDLEMAWLVRDRVGQICGFATVYRNGDICQVPTDVISPDPAAATWLLERVRVVGSAVAGRAGHTQAKIGQGIYGQDETMRARLISLGYEPTTVFNRMRIDHGRPPTPVPPPGVTLRNDPSDMQLRADAHRIVTESFREHFGFAEWTFEHWVESCEIRSTFDWSQLWVADLHGAPVGVLMTSDRYVEDENCGYVDDLGVLEEARGRGIATYLLRHAFARDVAAGRVGTILHVDANNVTPALGVYESVGMRAVLTAQVYERLVDAAEPAAVT